MKPSQTSGGSLVGAAGIWAAAAGYFICYAPYAALTKALTSGKLPGMDAPLKQNELLPVATIASFIVAVLFVAGTGWWRHATRHQVGGRSIPGPTRFTILSGLCTSAIIVTTTLAYTFKDVSILLMMLMMRGGVLIIAPIVDLTRRRKVAWFSWVGLALSLLSLSVAVRGDGKMSINALALTDVVVYLAGYFFRLQLMTRYAKGDKPEDTLRYFVEEQFVAVPSLLLALVGLALFLPGENGAEFTRGFTAHWTSWIVLPAMLVGALSQGTGIFGGLILLNPRENTYCVPVNRASSVLAGLVASAGLSFFLGVKAPGTEELVGATLMVAAIVVLSIPPLLARRKAARAAAAA